MLVTLIGISIIIFVLLRVVPGNIVDILFDAAGFVDPTDKANLEKELGLNLPIYVFNMDDERNIERIVSGEHVGTLVKT